METDEPASPAIGCNEHSGGQPTPHYMDKCLQDPGNQPRPTVNPNARLEPVANQSNRRKRHGYAAVEIHKGAARVIRWEVNETRETTPEQSEQQRRLFRLGEWLSKQPISDQARAKYFDIERVSHNNKD